MARNVAIKCLVIGEAPPGPNLEPIHLELAAERISVRDLIHRAVAEQIRELIERRRVEANVVQLALSRQYLTVRDVAEQAERGRIGLPPAPKRREAAPAAAIDSDREIATALRGFEAGAFRVVVDGVPQESLDDEIVLVNTTKIVFLRLTPLVGG